MREGDATATFSWPDSWIQGPLQIPQAVLIYDFGKGVLPFWRQICYNCARFHMTYYYQRR